MRLSLLIVLLFACLPEAWSQGPAGKVATPAAASIGIVVDCSGSQRLQMEKTIAIIKQIAEGLRPGDQVFIVRFVDTAKITVVQDFSSDKAELGDAADDLYIEGGQPAVVDAIDFADKHFADDPQSAERLHVLILVSDGDERKDPSKLDATVTKLKEDKVRLYAIGVSDLTVSTKLLDRLARDSGGKMFVPRSTAEVSNSVLDILASIHGEQAAKK
jgi:Ca-activated chloride channel family protein